jgi:hypothetical protein
MPWIDRVVSLLISCHVVSRARALCSEIPRAASGLVVLPSATFYSPCRPSHPSTTVPAGGSLETALVVLRGKRETAPAAVGDRAPALAAVDGSGESRFRSRARPAGLGEMARFILSVWGKL